ncbi:maleylpyruvate isomerase family mycothiol-dependent enzyme [soil metagenome]
MPETGSLPESDETFHATTRYLAALTELTARDLSAPSALPGWSRGHVVAHLSRNADAFTRVLRQVQAGEPASMYESSATRDRDIDETVGSGDIEALVKDATTSSERYAEAASIFDGDVRASTYTRTPADAETFPVSTVMPRRRTEVEVHHADLMLDYLPSQWPVNFSRALVRRRRDELSANGGSSFVLVSTDVDGLWRVGDGAGPQVSGAVGDLAWWLVGRGDGRGLVSSTGELPRLGRWR